MSSYEDFIISRIGGLQKEIGYCNSSVFSNERVLNVYLESVLPLFNLLFLSTTDRVTIILFLIAAAIITYYTIVTGSLECFIL